VADRSNEIPALAPLLSVLDLHGVVVTADALHTRVERAKVLVEEVGAHFVLVVKRNRPALWEACRSIEAAPEMLGRYARGHWGVENKIHYVRDVTFGEDASRIRNAARRRPSARDAAHLPPGPLTQPCAHPCRRHGKQFPTPP
jgi:predicted transposase YbfD/YdcC